MKKTLGTDCVPNLALRHLPFKTVAAMARLYNGILRTGQFPNIWKIGWIIMISKPGKDTRLPDSYRPITLLSNISKVFARILLRFLLLT